MKAIIFDFDGVIHDTFEFHRKKTSEFARTELSADAFRDLHNGNFFENGLEALKHVDWAEYGLFTRPELSLLQIKEDVRAVLLKLRVTYDLFIVSANLAENISAYLNSNRLSDVFKDILGMEAHTSKADKFRLVFKKHGLGPEDCLFVTDTLGDILEAKALGLRVVAVDFGYHSREILAKGGPFRIISDLNDIFMILS